MSKYGFLDVLDKALAKDFTYDYEINWDKKKPCGGDFLSIRC